MKFFLFSFLLFIYSCGTLKTAHSDNVKTFARSAKLLSRVPGELYNDIAAYRHQLKMIEVSTVHRTEKLIEELDKLYSIKRRYEDNALQITTSSALIESYCECLLTLTDAAYEKQWTKQGGELSLQLNTAFASYNTPFNKKLAPSVGQFIGGVVTQLGAVKLRSLQKKYLRSFVDTGSLIINDVCDYFTGSVSLTLDNELASLDKQFSNVMTTFYDNIYEYQKQQSINPFDYYKYYNPLYLEMKEKLEDLHVLESRTVAAMALIKAAHQGLKNSVDVALPAELITEINDLYTATAAIDVSLKKAMKK